MSNTWRDPDLLRAAVARSTSISQVVKFLGLQRSGAMAARVETALDEFGIARPVPKKPGMTRAAREKKLGTFADAAKVAAAVEGKRSQRAILVALGVAPSRSNYARLEKAAAAGGLTLPVRGTGGPKQPSGSVFDDGERLRELAASCHTKRAIMSALGLAANGSSSRDLNAALTRHGIEFTSNPAAAAAGRRVTLSQALASGSHTRIKRQLVAEGVAKNECDVCHLPPEWQGKPLTLRLDHIDGDRDNYAVENLRLICPNCDSQTDTYCAKNKKRAAGRYKAHHAKLREGLVPEQIAESSSD